MKHHLQWRKIREWFDHAPTISDHEMAKLNPPVHRAYFSLFPPWPTHFVWKNSIAIPKSCRSASPMLRLPLRGEISGAQNKGTTTFMFEQPWDAKGCKGNTTFMLDSPDTWNVQYIEKATCGMQNKKWNYHAHNVWCRNTWNVQYFAKDTVTGVTLQHHQVLCLAQKLMLQNQQMQHRPWKVTPQHHHMFPLPLKVTLRFAIKLTWSVKFAMAGESTMIRTWSEHDPNITWSSRARPLGNGIFRTLDPHFV